LLLNGQRGRLLGFRIWPHLVFKILLVKIFISWVVYVKKIVLGTFVLNFRSLSRRGRDIEPQRSPGLDSSKGCQDEDMMWSHNELHALIFQKHIKTWPRHGASKGSPCFVMSWGRSLLDHRLLPLRSVGVTPQWNQLAGN
jgi:hypothetical protein